MPFDFSGKLPVLQDMSGAFQPIYRSSNYRPIAAQLHLLPAFGPSISPSTIAPRTATTVHMQEADIVETPASSTHMDKPTAAAEVRLGSDTLSRAVRRAQAQRPAVFGSVEIAADALLKRYMDDIEDDDGEGKLEDLTTELAAVRNEYPNVTHMLQLVFDEAVRKMDPSTGLADLLRTFDDNGNRTDISFFVSSAAKDEQSSSSAKLGSSAQDLKISAKMTERGLFCKSQKRTSANSPISRHGQAVFRLLDLPPELRNRIYREALVPGVVSLRSGPHHTPCSVKPAIATDLLVTCKQVHQEAKSIMFENTFIVNAMTYSRTRSIIHRAQLPDAILDSVQSLVLVLDATQLVPPWCCDWRQLQAMTNLQEIRICGIQMIQGMASRVVWELILKEVLDRVPANCSVSYSSHVKVEMKHIAQFRADWEDHMFSYDYNDSEINTKETSAAVLRLAAIEATQDGMRQGRKSGSKRGSRWVSGGI